MAKKNFYNKTDLKGRGWTDTMIRDFASDATIDSIPGEWKRQRMDQYYYGIGHIKAIEGTPEFKARKPKKKAVKK